jgi:hypothetical protein
MGYAEKRGTGGASYYRGRFKVAPGRYGTLQHPDGSARKFRTKREAKQAADDQETRIRGGQWRNPTDGQIVFGQFANCWYAGLDLAPSTMQNYRRHLEEHLLPAFEASALRAILPAVVDAWEKGERAAGYKPASVPVAAGLTPHGLRHSNKSLMAELRTPEVLSHVRLGHELGGIAGRYGHVTAPMREE